MRRRAELVDDTRQRITEATARLHTTIGPAATTIAAIAEEAGVTRLTVYRHFPDLETLFAACQAHWLRENPPPDPAVWAGIEDDRERASRALDALYRWYAANAGALLAINRDFGAMPDSARRRSAQGRIATVTAILGGADAAAGRTARERAAVGHAVSYWTWRSLAVDQGLSHADTVDLAVRLIEAARPDVSSRTRRGSTAAS